MNTNRHSRRAALDRPTRRGAAFRFPIVVAVTVASLSVVFAQTAADSAPTATEMPGIAIDGDIALLTDRMLLDADVLGESAVRFGLEFTHYDSAGFPEDENGRIVLRRSPDGPVATLRGDPAPFLLYAQYANRQRDAVFLARTGTINDVLPNGLVRPIPFGYGAVKLNTVYVSTLEAIAIPHFSDNQKEYVDFPLSDFYIGASFGLTGVSAVARYVHTERWVAGGSIGVNPFGSVSASSVLNRYWVPVHLSGGYRFPGVFPEFLGENVWTLGSDLLLGFGDRDGDPATPAAVMLPGVFLDIERVLFDEAGLRRDYRTDPRPYNYRVNSVVFRIAAYLNLSNLGSGNIIMPSFGVSYQYNIIGPRIPDHEFKETRVIYLHELYREDLERQVERRDARQSR